MVWQGTLSVPGLSTVAPVDSSEDGVLYRVRFETLAECSEGAFLVVVIELPPWEARVLSSFSSADESLKSRTLGLLPGTYALRVYAVGAATLEKLTVTGL